MFWRESLSACSEVGWAPKLRESSAGLNFLYWAVAHSTGKVSLTRCCNSVLLQGVRRIMSKRLIENNAVKTDDSDDAVDRM